MNINVGDKIVAKKSTWIADEGKVGIATEVVDNFISFVFEGNPKVSCKMDFDTFNEYFAKVEVFANPEKETVEIPTITEEYIAEIMENSEFETFTTFDKCTIVSCRLPNGFVITESSACVNTEDYDVEYGADICFDKIAARIWELEAYRLQQHLWEEEVVEMGECPCDCDNCEECPYDDEAPCC